MKYRKQHGFINIPGWFFWLAPIGAILIAVNVIQVAMWLFEHLSWSWK